MNSSTLLLVLISVLASAAGQVLFKMGASSPTLRQALTSSPASVDTLVALVQSPGIVGGLFVYALSVFLWIGVLSRVDLSLAYPFVGLGIAVTTFAGVFMFGESVSVAKLAGAGLVIAGICLLALSG